jgi:hypothetical protein
MSEPLPPKPQAPKPDYDRLEPVRDHVTTGYELRLPIGIIEIEHPNGTKVLLRYER